MKQVHKQICYSLAAVSIMLGLATVPASAEHGATSVDGPRGVASTQINTGSGTVGADSLPNRDSSGSGSSSGSQTENETSTEGANDDSGHQSGKLRSEAALLLTQDREHGKQHSAAERQLACQKRQANINKHSARFAAQAAKHLSTFNGIFTKLQAFHDNKKLTVANYDALVADATAKQTAAQSAVDALKSVDVSIDCSQPDPASTVATIKTAVSSARTALQDYRTSLKNLVVALKGASTAQSSTQSTDNSQTTGGTQ